MFGSVTTFWLELAIVTVSATIALITYYKYVYSYWKSRGVPDANPQLPKGNMEGYFLRGFSIGLLSSRFYQKFKAEGHRFGGIYLGTRPVLVPTDLELVRSILSKDFEHFADRGIYYTEKNCFSANLFTYDPQKWRNLRVKLTPVFTSGKLKMTFPTVVECGRNMAASIRSMKREPVHIKEVAACFTTDVIGSAIFGLECNSFKSPDTELRKNFRAFVQGDFWLMLRQSGSLLLPKIYKYFGVSTTPKPVYDFFVFLISETMQQRRSLNIVRNDFLQLLIDLQKSTIGTKNQLTSEEIIKQCFLFFGAGSETSSALIAFSLYELARNEAMQQKLREEINKIIEKNGEITYETLMDAKYLHQVVSETLRIYPALPSIDRQCVKDYHIPDTDIVIEKDTKVLIPVYGLQNDPEFFPNPEVFDPERFNAENKGSFPPFAYLPFGEGPRNCIGMRFGMMQSKLGLALLVKDFKVSVNARTKPLEFNEQDFLMTPKNPVYLDFQNIGE